LFVVQLLHALSFGATHLGAMALLARLAPAHRMASAQGYLVALTGMLSASAGLVCGRLYPAWGPSIYYGMAGLALCGTIVMLAMRRRLNARGVAT
jgi:PPP family 3-phenylpropionic acid transporter